MANPLARSPYNTLQCAINDMFDDFSRSWDVPRLGTWDMPRVALEPVTIFNPRIDVTENDKSVRIIPELPGMDDKDIDLTLADGALLLKGEKKAEHEEKKENFYRMECSYGAFQRTIPLPCEVDAEKVSAKFSKGVLTVDLAKSPSSSRTRKIAVKAT